ncbi:MAG TPA: hypothetical protein PLR20_11610 [Syntrophales bacterium]|nr:hypothetical protein [Syntrophales bacterium]HOX93833.1 hypothetical protein [Syntrophales bacterium]HPI57001.1 hypothetical protein [Syntrophales bacterium]HPN23869.1 hypothetical protein [Syntrophales bacterium]HQM29988.1 hypothetical protein [Syntrophales bacterium]
MKIGVITGLFFLMIGCGETAGLQWHQYENRDQFVSPKSECVHVLSDGWTILGPVDPDLYLYQWGWRVTVKTGACSETHWIESLEYVIFDKDGSELARNALSMHSDRKPGFEEKASPGGVIALSSDSTTTYQQTGTIAASRALKAADGRFVLKLGRSGRR